MDWTDLREAARASLDPVAWDYFAGTAGAPADADRDAAAWREMDLVPRYLRGIGQTVTVDTSTVINRQPLATPLFLAPTAAHGLADPAAEAATARAAASAGTLMILSNSSTLHVAEFAAATGSPWWLQIYLMQERTRTTDLLARAVDAGAGAIVLTIDYGGPIGDASFRAGTSRRLAAQPGNYPGWSWTEMTAGITPAGSLEDIEWIAQQTGLPVWVKGVLHPADADALATAGVAAGLIVSNHGRRTLDPVTPTARVLGPIAAAVAGRVPVLVDGGIRSGADVFRAIALGAAGAGIGRPALWALAAGGQDGVSDALIGLTAELRQVMATCGAATLADITANLLAPH